jgi:hypothetical protein
MPKAIIFFGAVMLARRYWQSVQRMAGALRNIRQSPRFAKVANVRAMTDERAPKKPKNAEVERLVEATGRTQAEIGAYLTRRLGRTIEHYHISRMINGGRKIAHDEMDALRELAAQPADQPPAAPQLTESTDVVPLFGFANAAGSVVRLNEEARVGVVPIHPAQHHSRGGYAFITFGDSTSPRLTHGDVGYAIRNHPPSKDQLCVVVKRDGEALVKFFDHLDDRTLFLYEIFPKRREITIPRQNLVHLDAVVGATFR